MIRNNRPVIGVLALQGDFAAHARMLNRLGVETREIRLSGQLNDVDGLIIPGGESTTLVKLMEGYGFIQAVDRFARSGRPIFGTCAGTILLAAQLVGTTQKTLHLIDIEVIRNAYGRQVDSFEAETVSPVFGSEPVPLVFIRAPVITSCRNGVEKILEYGGNVILARQDNILVATFHPELTDDLRLHRYFLAMIKNTVCH